MHHDVVTLDAHAGSLLRQCKPLQRCRTWTMNEESMAPVRQVQVDNASHLWRTRHDSFLRGSIRSNQDERVRRIGRNDDLWCRADAVRSVARFCRNSDESERLVTRDEQWLGEREQLPLPRAKYGRSSYTTPSAVPR